MSKFAVIQLAGKQYIVSEGDRLVVDRLSQAADETFKVSDVLLVSDDKSVSVGTPLVDKAAVTLKVVNEQQGEKIRVAKYKSKSRYRKVKGHRQQQSVVEVVKIAA